MKNPDFAAPLGVMSNTTINRVGTGVPAGGEFTFRDRTESGVILDGGTPAALSSEFIDGSPATREAAVIFQARTPDATAEDFEDNLYDTYSADEYQHDLDRPDSELRTLSQQLRVVELPSGGFAVFWG